MIDLHARPTLSSLDLAWDDCETDPSISIDVDLSELDEPMFADCETVDESTTEAFLAVLDSSPEATLHYLPRILKIARKHGACWLNPDGKMVMP